MPRQLTTAETLVLEVLVAHQRLGAQDTTLDRRLWVKPQLETLRELGLVTWTYDENADFRVTATEQLMTSPEAIMIASRLTYAGHTAPSSGAFA